ncbi:MAG: DUF177 domain-containing protein [Halioglobus sp.]|nr:DUF177 domain-containing protein [Halioglobus sp.]
MLSEPLPATLDVRKAAARGVSVKGVIQPSDLSRFRELLADDKGSIAVDMAFNKDDQEHYVIGLDIRADVTVTCQRCLQSMPLHVHAVNSLGVVWTDSQAATLPGHLEPLIVEEPPCNLWEVVEEELMLALPTFSYHDTEECRRGTLAFTDEAPDEPAPVDKPNPFDVLVQLKPGEKKI